MTPEVRPSSSTPENAGPESVVHQPMDFSEMRRLDDERREKKRIKKKGNTWAGSNKEVSDLTPAKLLSMNKRELASFVEKNKKESKLKVDNSEGEVARRKKDMESAELLNAAREKHQATVVFTNEEKLPTHRREFHSARVVPDEEIDQKEKKEPEELVEA